MKPVIAPGKPVKKSRSFTESPWWVSFSNKISPTSPLWILNPRKRRISTSKRSSLSLWISPVTRKMSLKRWHTSQRLTAVKGLPQLGLRLICSQNLQRSSRSLYGSLLISVVPQLVIRREIKGMTLARSTLRVEAVTTKKCSLYKITCQAMTKIWKRQVWSRDWNLPRKSRESRCPPKNIRIWAQS